MTDPKKRQSIPVAETNYTTSFGDQYNQPPLAPITSTSALELKALETGSENQRERYAAGLLPEDELAGLARIELFKGFGETKRWAGRDREALGRQVKHSVFPGVLGEPTCLGVAFETADVAELDANEWTQLKKVRELADAVRSHPWLQGGAVTVAASTHWATCTTCEAEACRSSVKVSIAWAGRTLTREYAL